MKLRLFLWVLVAIAAGLAAGLYVYRTTNPPSLPGGSSTGTALVGGPFTMVDQEGRPRDQTMMQGRWTLVFFGFTHCPDVCPTTLQTLAAAKEALGPAGEQVQIVLVSVDPERDTPENLKAYLDNEAFPPGVIGLTGTPEQLARTARAYRAFYAKEGDGPDYMMQHSSAIYLMGPDGRFRSALAERMGPEEIARQIRAAMAEGGSGNAQAS